MVPHSNERLEGSEQLTTHEDVEAARLLAEGYSDTAPLTTRYRDITPTPTQGSAVPAPQPGARPPMSQRATDISVLMLSAGAASLPVGGATALVLWQLSSVPATTLAVTAAIPAGLLATVGIAARMLGRAVRDGATALPDTTVHHHHGPTHVQHTELHTDTRWLGKTVNQLPGNR